MPTFTNEFVQLELNFAISLLREGKVSLPGDLNDSVRTYLEWMAVHSASGNSIPALARRGLEEALAVAASIIALEPR